MVRFILAACLFLVLAPAWGQVEELPELNPEVLKDNWLQKLYDELNSLDARLSFNNRIRIMPDTYYALTSVQGQDKEMKLNLNLCTRNDKPSYANFQLRRNNPKTTLREFSLGSLTPSWALGTVLKKDSGKGNLFRLGNAGNPENVTPLGVGAVWGWRNYSAFVMSARQQRSARLNDGLITTLYTGKREDLNKVMESLSCAGVETKLSALRLGLMAYVQSYDYPFSNADYARHLEAISLAARWETKALQFTGEAAVIEEQTAVKAVFGISQGAFRQSIGYSGFQNSNFPAYAARPGILSNQGKRSELTWDMDVPFSSALELSLRNAISRNNNSVKSPVWLSRNILYLSYKPGATQVSVQFSRYDRELVAFADSSYTATLPVHYRCNARIRHRLNKQLELCFSFRYHYEDQKQRNSFYWENYMVWTGKKLNASAGLRSWQSLHRLAIPDASMGDADGVYISSSEDNQVFGRFGYRLKKFHLDMELRQSWLDGYRSIYLNLGI